MKRNLVFSFVAVFAAISFWGLWTEAPSSSIPVQRSPAALGYWTQSCEYIFANRGPYFDIGLFQNFLGSIRQERKLDPKDMKAALGHPEAFLAMIEYLSRGDAYEGFNFSKKLSELKPKDLKKLRTKIFKATRGGELSETELKNLMVEIYRLVHQPRGYWRTAWKTRDLAATFRRIDDQKIAERIEMSLFRNGMIETYEAIIKDQKEIGLFRNLLAHRSSLIQLGLGGGLYAIAIASRPEFTADPDLAKSIAAQISDILIWAPAFVPSLAFLFEKSLAIQELNLYFTKDLEQQEFKAGLQKQLQKNRNQARAAEILRHTYMLVFATTLSISLEMAFHEREVLEYNREVARIEAEFKAQDKVSLQRELDAAKPAEQRARERFETDYQELRKMGTNPPAPGTPEYELLKKGIVQQWTAIYEAQK